MQTAPTTARVYTIERDTLTITLCARVDRTISYQVATDTTVRGWQAIKRRQAAAILVDARRSAWPTTITNA